MKVVRVIETPFHKAVKITIEHNSKDLKAIYLMVDFQNDGLKIKFINNFNESVVNAEKLWVLNQDAKFTIDYRGELDEFHEDEKIENPV